MIRYRAPTRKSSPYVTAVGYRTLKAELDDLWVSRRDVVLHLQAAAAEGDRSENAEYIYRKKQLREIDRRIRYLQKRIPDLQVVDALPGDREKVFFGATVILGDETGEECSHRIVGADETDAKTGWISVDSPMSKALLGKRLDEEVTVRTPTGSKMYWILAIDYEAFHD